MNLKKSISLSVIALGLISFVGCSDSNNLKDAESKDNTQLEQADKKEETADSKDQESTSNENTTSEQEESKNDDKKEPQNPTNSNDKVSQTTNNPKEEIKKNYLTEEESLEKLKASLDGYVKLNELKIGDGKNGKDKVIRVNDEDYYVFYEIGEEMGDVGEDRYLVGTKSGTMYAERNFEMGTYIPLDDFIINVLKNRG